jgi:hypothetical protein
MATPELSAVASVRRPYDAFISYSTKDLRIVRRLHRFLESYRIGQPKGRVRVFLDRTDIRGGGLTAELREALVQSNKLVVCWSSSAADSRWVHTEVELFRELHGAANIAIAVLSAHEGLAKIESLADVECRQHDLRPGWLLGLALPKTQLELLRLLAFITNVDMRTLRNWHVRRTVALAVVWIILTLVPLAALLFYPIQEWTRLPVELPQQMARGASNDRQLYMVACETNRNQLWAAWRFKGQRPMGYASYLFETPNALDPTQSPRQSDTYHLRSRLLPVELLAANLRSRLPSLTQSPEPGRTLVGSPFGGEPKPGHYVVIQGLRPTDEEEQAIKDAAGDIGTISEADIADAIPKVKRSVVIVSAEGVSTQAIVDDMAPEWQTQDTAGDPTPPSRGITVVWLDDDQILIGIQAVGKNSRGGLWQSQDLGRSWQKIEGFANVTSLFVEYADQDGEEVLIAESFFEGWDGGLLTPHAARVRRWRPHQPISLLTVPPPYNTRSEVDFCGSIDGAPVVRIDPAAFQQRTRPLWRTLAGS